MARAFSAALRLAALRGSCRSFLTTWSAGIKPEIRVQISVTPSVNSEYRTIDSHQRFISEDLEA